MIRTILVIVFLVFFLIFTIPFIIVESLLLRKYPNKNRMLSNKIVHFAFRTIIFISGVKIIVHGRENLISNQAALYVGNHRGFFDIIISHILMTSPTGFIAKKSMIKIPLLSNWMKLIGCLFIDRENLKEGIKTILQGIEYIKSGITLWIFPEGGRNKNSNPLDVMEFKEGSLRIAEKAKCPVLPVAFYGTDDVLENHFPFIKSKTVHVSFAKPIIISELSAENRKALGAYTRGIILGMLEEIHKN